MLKVTVLVALTLVAALGAWYWYPIEEGLELGIRITDVEDGPGNEIDLGVDVRIRSSRDADVVIDHLELLIQTGKDGDVLVEETLDRGMLIPAHGEYHREHRVTYMHSPELDDEVYITVTVEADGHVRRESRTVELPI